MAKLSPARKAALAVVSERRRRDARVRDLLRTHGAVEALEPRDRALCTRLATGAVLAEGALDEAINAQLKPGVKLEPRVRDALRVAAFELLYLSTPAEVAASQGVELVRSVQPRAAGLANAVLRKLAGGKQRLGFLNPLPAWLLEYVDPANVLEPPTPSVAGLRPDAGSLLAEAGCEPAPGPLPRSFILGCQPALARSGLVESCSVVPCDLAAQEVVAAAEPAPGERVLEVGQGRGTKTLLLMAEAQAAGGFCDITAVELDPGKSALAARRMEAAGIADHVNCIAEDGCKLADRDDLGVFDLVFVDAPCSGTGTIRRHPEIAWSLDSDAPAELAKLQLELLAAASARVAPGGRLVYATCSVLPAENEDVVNAFLAAPSGQGFSLDSMGPTSGYGSDTHFWARFLLS